MVAEAGTVGTGQVDTHSGAAEHSWVEADKPVVAVAHIADLVVAAEVPPVVPGSTVAVVVAVVMVASGVVEAGRILGRCSGSWD